MKKLMLVAAAVAASVITTFGATQYIYSSDGVTAGSGARALPVQAVNLKTGKVVLGLQRLTDAERVECGWYRIVPFSGEVGTNQYFVCTNYTFNATGTADQIGVIKDKPKMVTKYSKLAIYQEVCKLGKWAALEKWMQDTTISNVNLYQAWTYAQYLTDANELFAAAKEAAGTAMGLTPAEVDELLAKCEDGKERASSK